MQCVGNLEAWGTNNIGPLQLKDVNAKDGDCEVGLFWRWIKRMVFELDRLVKLKYVASVDIHRLVRDQVKSEAEHHPVGSFAVIWETLGLPLLR